MVHAVCDRGTAPTRELPSTPRRCRPKKPSLLSPDRHRESCVETRLNAFLEGLVVGFVADDIVIFHETSF
jgi:hypothetical protein